MFEGLGNYIRGKVKKAFPNVAGKEDRVVDKTNAALKKAQNPRNPGMGNRPVTTNPRN